MIGDYIKHTLIGTYVDTNIDNNDFKIICAKADDIFYHIKESQAKIKKNNTLAVAISLKKSQHNEYFLQI